MMHEGSRAPLLQDVARETIDISATLKKSQGTDVAILLRKLKADSV
jgi:hypothetical protein